CWVDEARVSAVRERWADASGMTTLIRVAREGGPAPTEALSRVWFAAPNRWRIERAAGGHETVDISDGDQRWQGLAGVGTGRGRDPTLASSDALGWMLVPGLLLGLLTFGDILEADLAGRRCITARARPRSPGRTGPMGLLSLTLGGFGLEATEHRFWLDA